MNAEEQVVNVAKMGDASMSANHKNTDRRQGGMRARCSLIGLVQASLKM